MRGTPQEDSWEGVTALPNYLRTFPKFKTVEFVNSFPQLSAKSILLLDQCLQLDPSKRLYAHEILNGVVYNDVRLENPKCFAFEEIFE